MSKTSKILTLLLALTLLAACSTQVPPVVTDAPPIVSTPTAISNLPEAQVEETAPPETGRFDPEAFASSLGDYVLRPTDLPNAYRVPEDGEKRISNLGVIQNIGEVKGKHYIVQTGRVDGWYLQLERRRKEEIIPGVMESAIELFESSEGAKLALSPEWFQAYQDEDNPPTWIEDGCDIGDQCLFFYYQSIDPATEVTKLEYDVAFVYKNVMVWVLGRGLDIDVKPEYVLKAAEAVYTRLEQAS
jgi:hypothetical protein